MKMYILLKETLPNKFAPVVSAHSSLACYKKFETDDDMQTWINSIFKKVVCTVTEAEFEKAKTEDKHIVLTESALDNAEVAIAFSPREEYPKRFKFFRMWMPN
jgi:hypothetical protein